MKRTVIFLLFLMGALALPAHAQDESWRIYLIFRSNIWGDPLDPMIVTSEGVTRFSASENYVLDLGASPNGLNALYAMSGKLYVLENGNCCTEVTPAYYVDMRSEHWRFGTVGINDDASQYILTFGITDSSNRVVETRVDLIDRASEAVLFSNQVSGDLYLKIVSWTDDEIVLLDSDIRGENAWTFPIEAPNRYEYCLNLHSGELTNDGIVRHFEEAWLQDEVVETAFLPNYPYDNAQHPNVLLFNEDTVIYVNSDHLNLNEFEPPRWVLNGEAILLASSRSGEAIIIYRDGRILESGVLRGYEFMAGTPEGWLAHTGNIIYHYFIKDGAIAWEVVANTPVDETREFMIHVYTTPMRPASRGFAESSQAQEAFQTLTPTPTSTLTSTPTHTATPSPTFTLTSTYAPAPTTASGGIQCPDFLPSQLQVGQPARVTPGDPNNLRAQPDRESTLIGTVPGEAEFMVLEGPVCADEMAYWKINYNGLIGWSSEGRGNQYWMEPVR